MSEQVLTGSLVDFGNSFWRSPLALEEFPEPSLVVTVAEMSGVEVPPVVLAPTA